MDGQDAAVKVCYRPSLLQAERGVMEQLHKVDCRICPEVLASGALRTAGRTSLGPVASACWQAQASAEHCTAGTLCSDAVVTALRRAAENQPGAASCIEAALQRHARASCANKTNEMAYYLAMTNAGTSVENYAYACGGSVCGITFTGLVASTPDEASPGTMDMQSWSTLCIGMLDALSAMHSAGFVHGDVKPANFCVCETVTVDGLHERLEVRVVDFGCSRAAAKSVARDMFSDLAFTGTVDFASRSMLELRPATFADDLGAPGPSSILPHGVVERTVRRGRRPINTFAHAESLLLSILRCFLGDLPWHGAAQAEVAARQAKKKAFDEEVHSCAFPHCKQRGAARS